MDGITLFHISVDLPEKLDPDFYPRVPANRTSEEDGKTKRICLCDSIDGCLTALDDNKIDLLRSRSPHYVCIWEKEFLLSDPNLVGWRELYERSMVPDAALTHEYWYLSPTKMTGGYYEIINLDSVLDFYEIQYMVNPKYKDAILTRLSDLGINERELLSLDPCTIVNSWLPSHYRESYDVLFDSIKEVLQVASCDDSDADEGVCRLIFGEFPAEWTVTDADPLRVYSGLEVRKVAKYEIPAGFFSD